MFEGVVFPNPKSAVLPVTTFVTDSYNLIILHIDLTHEGSVGC